MLLVIHPSQFVIGKVQPVKATFGRNFWLNMRWELFGLRQMSCCRFSFLALSFFPLCKALHKWSWFFFSAHWVSVKAESTICLLSGAGLAKTFHNWKALNPTFSAIFAGKVPFLMLWGQESQTKWLCHLKRQSTEQTEVESPDAQEVFLSFLWCRYELSSLDQPAAQSYLLISNVIVSNSRVIGRKSKKSSHLYNAEKPQN